MNETRAVFRRSRVYLLILVVCGIYALLPQRCSACAVGATTIEERNK